MILRQNPNQRKRSGFTLMEIIVVVAIILILAGSGVFIFMGVLESTHEDRAKLDVRSIEKAVEVWKVKHHDYPASLQDLVNVGPNGEPALLDESALRDPWGDAYQYNAGELHPKTRKPHIWSTGPRSAPKMIDNWGKIDN